MALKLECGYLKGFIGEHEYAAMASQVESAHALLASGKGPGNDFLGWVDLPTNYDKEEFARIKAAAERIKKNTDVFIVIGIGGSYLGARAAIEFLKSEHYNALKKDTPDIYFTGNSISSTALAELVEICEGQAIFHQHYFQVRHHHRDGYGVPCSPRAPREEVWQGRSKEAHLLPPPT